MNDKIIRSDNTPNNTFLKKHRNASDHNQIMVYSHITPKLPQQKSVANTHIANLSSR